MYIVVYRLSIFGDFKRFSPTADFTVQCVQKLKEYNCQQEFLPNIIPEGISAPVPFVVQQPAGNSSRMTLVAQDGSIVLRILSNRIDVEFPQPISKEPSDFSNSLTEMLRTSTELIHILTELVNETKGIRLAYYADIHIPDPQESFKNFFSSYNLNLNLDGTPDECVEWSHRFNRQINILVDSQEELSNVILAMESATLHTVNRITQETINTPGLHLMVDINTQAENTEEKFSADNCTCFCTIAQSIFLNLFSQIKDMIAF